MKKRALSILLVLALTVTLFAGLAVNVSAAEPTSAGEVKYVQNGQYIYNWGKRDTVATFLTTYAQNYYTGSYSYATLAAKSGDSGTGTGFYNSSLGTAIHSMLTSKQSYTTSYDATRPLFKYTDCEESGNKISSFYSGALIGPEWDSGSSWNREHTWPNSKGLNGRDEDDIMMLRPTANSENSSRGNDAYGKSGSYFDPNQYGEKLHGDIARLMLQHLMRWGNTSAFYGTGGVMESRAVLLEWLTEDPVDTWEMGRNDAVQAITGVRNVFVDYPELAFKLLGATMPANYPTPSGGSGPAYEITAVSNNTDYGTVSVSGSTITASPKTGYYAKDYTVTSGTATVTQDGNLFTVNPTSDCTVCINFAPKTAATVFFSCPAGVSCASISGYAGDAIKLPTPSGKPTGEYEYTFKGWVRATVDNSETKPATIYAAGSSYTPSGNETLYALYTYTIGGTGDSSVFEKITSSSDLTDGASYVITSSTSGKAMSSNVASNWVYPGGTYTGSTVSSPAAADIWTISGGVISCSAGSLTSSGAKNISLSTNGTKWDISYKDGAWSIASGTNILSFNASGWRPYSGGYGDDRGFNIYKGGAGGTTYYTTVIGEVEPCEHDYVAAVTAPTCTEGGYTTYTCSKCGDSYVADEIAALGHDYVTETVAPTETEKGYDLHTCTRCGDSYKDNWTLPIDPIETDPIETEPIETEPIETEPIETEPIETEPIETEPIETEPVVTEPIETEPVETEPCEGYTDIDRSSWYHEAADFVLARGIMGSTKTDEKTFEPFTVSTRAMIAQMLYSLEDKPAVTFEAKFPDVKQGQWFTDAVMWAYQNGVVTGYDNGNFGPNDKVTREQMAVILKAYAEKVKGIDTSKTADLSKFADAAKVTWSKPYITWAVAEGLLSGKAVGSNLNLDPQGNATRAEVAAIMRSFITNIIEAAK